MPSSSSRSPEEVLGVPAGANAAVVRRAYRRLAFEWHPDRHPVDKDVAEARFLEVAQAYADWKAPGGVRARYQKRERTARRERPRRNAPPRDESSPPPPPGEAKPRRAPSRRAVRALARDLAAGEKRAHLLERSLRIAALVLPALGGQAAFLAPEVASLQFAAGLLTVFASPFALGWAWILFQRRIESYFAVAEQILRASGPRDASEPQP